MADHAFGDFDNVQFDSVNGILGLLLLDTVHLCLERCRVFFELSLAVCTKFSVNLIPILGITWFVWFLIPVRNITFDKFEPYLTITATDLGRGYFNLSL